MPTPIALSLIGATGSIGSSTLKVVDRYPDRLKVVALTGGSNVERLVELCRKYRPQVAAIAAEGRFQELREALSGLPIEIRVGPDGFAEAAAWPSATTTVIATVGFAGVRPTLAAINAGKRIALANKETLVAAGSLVMPLAKMQKVSIAPIDSEHSAVWQCLRAGTTHEVKRLILTASGGPFRTRPLETFDSITPAEALAHPTWKMGQRITVDSATMMNKGFEIIEAAWLFGIEPQRIDVVIHPSSIVHSLVEFQDNSMVAQLGAPDMTLPITYALFAPERVRSALDAPKFDPMGTGAFEFYLPDPKRYPALGLARSAFALGPTGGCVLNAADEVAVAAFLEERLPFSRITAVVEETLADHTVVPSPTIDDIELADRWARSRADQLIAKVGSGGA